MTSKTKILYVDDEPINLRLFEINFSKKYEVHSASDGYQGLELLATNPEILAVISDMKMPGMSGLEFIRKAKERFPSKKYYILTGFEITPEIKAAIDNGLILKYFRKPFDPKEVEKTIEAGAE